MTSAGVPTRRSSPCSSSATSSQRLRIEPSAWETITIVLPLLAELGELLEAPPLELGVADREHLVDEQDVGIDVDRHREPEPHVHARRVVLHRRVDELLEPGEARRSRRSARRAASSTQAEDRAVEVDVVAARQLGMEAGAELEERRDLALGDDRRRGSGRRIRAMHFSSVLLPDPFSPMSPNVEPSGTSNETSFERPELLVARPVPPHHRRLQRLVALVVEAEPLRDVLDTAIAGVGTHTSSASRRSSLRNTHEPEGQQRRSPTRMM